MPQISIFNTLPPLSLYVHIPWCVRKCPYCDFNSHAQPATLPVEGYLSALLDDLRRDAHLAQGRRLQSIFFGGGTPSLFPARAIGDVIAQAETHFGFAKDMEITLEANPGTAEHGNFADLNAAGVNRLSIGVQSFSNPQLQRLGRIHDSNQALAAFELARRAGFDNINLDLMHGLPDQTVDQGLSDLAQAIALQPEHLSWYQLTIEPNTAFYNQPPVLPEDDTLCDIQDRGHELLRQAGYCQYEVSAYTKPGRQAKHNLNYWEFGDYLAIGAGAHGKITTVEGIHRYNKTRLPTDYMAKDKNVTASTRIVARENLPLEFMMNGLRLIEGVPSRLFEERTGIKIESIETKLSKLVSDNLLENYAESLRATGTGQRFLNNVLSVFM